MEEKKLEWQLEQPKEEMKEPQKEDRLDKTALADYIISKMPAELVARLREGKDMESLVMQWENRMLKKENDALKKRLEKETAKPLTLAGEGGEGAKDPFVAGFMQAMANY